MMNSKIRSVMFACFGLLFGMSVMYVYNNFIAEKKAENTTISDVRYGETKNTDDYNNSQNFNDITELTEENKVISYVKENHHLPEYYITKSEAKKQGWNPSQGNLCEVLPGKAIGGDYFGNREGRLPKD